MRSQGDLDSLKCQMGTSTRPLKFALIRRQYEFRLFWAGLLQSTKSITPAEYQRSLKHIMRQYFDATIARKGSR